MNSFPQSSTLPMFFVLTDSHGKFVPSTITTSTYSINVHSVSGLKWLDTFNTSLSATHLLSSSNFDSHLTSIKALMLLIGTNSVRCTPALTIMKRNPTHY